VYEGSSPTPVVGGVTPIFQGVGVVSTALALCDVYHEQEHACLFFLLSKVKAFVSVFLLFVSKTCLGGSNLF
jgi:hypothetical protein